MRVKVVERGITASFLSLASNAFVYTKAQKQKEPAFADSYVFCLLRHNLKPH